MTGVGRAAPSWLLPGSSGRQQRWLGGVRAVLSRGGTPLSPGAGRAPGPWLPRAGPAAGGRPGDPAPAAGIQGAFCRLPGGPSAASSPPSRPLPSPALPSPPLPSPLPPGGSGRGRRRPHVSPPGLRQPRWARRAAGTGSEEGAMNPAAPSRRRASPASPLAGSRGLAAPQPWYVPGGWGRVVGAPLPHAFNF